MASSDRVPSMLGKRRAAAKRTQPTCKKFKDYQRPYANFIGVKGVASASNVDFESLWVNLSTAINQIHTKNASLLSYESLYRDAYKLVLKKEGAQLYNRLQKFEKDWLKNVVGQRIISRISLGLQEIDSGLDATTESAETKAAGEGLMKGLKEAWEDHCVSMNMITDVMTYLVSHSHEHMKALLTKVRTAYTAPRTKYLD